MLWTDGAATTTETIMGLLDILGGSGARRGGGMSPITMALLGLLAYRTYQGKGRLADMIGRKPGEAGAQGGGLGDLLGGLTGGAAAGGLGGLLSGGLGDLLKQFQEHGQEDKAKSWVSTGPNKEVSPQELEQALGAERIEWLTQQTGMSRQELLEGLSRELPDAVDKLTPEGRVPTEQEATRLLQ
jgi:uncharacterized protein YidB (DUF937 family)